jgi:hypothetical protein
MLTLTYLFCGHLLSQLTLFSTNISSQNDGLTTKSDLRKPNLRVFTVIGGEGLLLF